MRRKRRISSWPDGETILKCPDSRKRSQRFFYLRPKPTSLLRILLSSSAIRPRGQPEITCASEVEFYDLVLHFWYSLRLMAGSPLVLPLRGWPTEDDCTKTVHFFTEAFTDTPKNYTILHHARQLNRLKNQPKTAILLDPKAGVLPIALPRKRQTFYFTIAGVGRKVRLEGLSICIGVGRLLRCRQFVSLLKPCSI